MKRTKRTAPRFARIPKPPKLSSAPAGVGRPAIKREEIVHHLHSQIISGKLKPDDRLPTRRELQIHFQASLSTIQQALDQLSDEGFVVPRGKAGTFVAAEPPHKTRYGIVVPKAAHAHDYPRFWRALVNEASRLQASGRSLRVYENIEEKTSAPDYISMVSDIERHRLAGLIFVANPFFLEGEPFLERAGVPCVSIGSASGMLKKLVAIRLDGVSFAKKAVAHLLNKGRRRIALILPSSHDLSFRKPFIEALAAENVPIKPYWLQEASPGAPFVARHLAHLMMRLQGEDRPDGMILGDDNLVEHATAGIVDAGVRVPDELEVVAHCNFPWPTPSVVSVRRLGYDAREVIAQCVKCIDAQRAGEPATMPPPIPARFEDELVEIA